MNSECESQCDMTDQFEKFSYFIVIDFPFVGDAWRQWYSCGANLVKVFSTTSYKCQQQNQASNRNSEPIPISSQFLLSLYAVHSNNNNPKCRAARGKWRIISKNMKMNDTHSSIMECARSCSQCCKCARYLATNRDGWVELNIYSANRFHYHFHCVCARVCILFS